MGYEYLLYSDSHISGETEFGPYKVIQASAQPSQTRRIPSPVLVLRLKEHNNFVSTDHAVGNDKRYHGGTLVDEVAALLSLELGSRLSAGTWIREFRPDEPEGKPVLFGIYDEPALAYPTEWQRQPVIRPSQLKVSTLSQISLLLQLEPNDAVALVKAARQFQQGVWVAETDANLGWLFLVSAVEAAADHYYKGEEFSIREWKKDLYDILHKADGDDLVEKIENKLHGLYGATQKFRSFLIKFLPDPPADRPEEAFQINYNKDNLTTIFNKIYRYRSGALHAGKPFPAPMCMPPIFSPPNASVPPETPSGKGIGNVPIRFEQDGALMFLLCSP